MILSSALFYGYAQINYREGIWSKNKKIIFERSSAYQKLKDSLCHLTLDKTLSETEAFLYNDAGTLYFTYNNGVDKEPWFSSSVEGKIFVNEKRELVLESRPLSVKWPELTFCRRELLLHHVNRCDFEFYLRPLKDDLNVSPEKVAPPDGTHPLVGFSKQWKLVFRVLPYSLKIDVTHEIEGKTSRITFPFILCNS